MRLAAAADAAADRKIALMYATNTQQKDSLAKDKAALAKDKARAELVRAEAVRADVVAPHVVCACELRVCLAFYL